MGCSDADEHTFVFEGILEGGTDPGAEVDVALGAQSGEGVVEFWRDTDQQGFIFHLISEYITGRVTGDHEVDGGGRGVLVLGTASLPFGATLSVIPGRGWSWGRCPLETPEKGEFMSLYRELRRHWLGESDEEIAGKKSTPEDVQKRRARDLAKLTEKALENIVRGVVNGDVQATIWLDERRLIQLPRPPKKKASIRVV